ncbi:hypothetical protein [Streptomyces chrestomyceticus]|uniref:hypothetical protein n=1 Tax=Streptomyces chrestomyceticus TaxID=68185 RepID=UPI0019CF8329|nr:hypothetical protein [Streptomyces chrestomyceticus]
MSVRIDAAVPVPDQHGQFWLLYGNKYVRIHFAGGEPHEDTVVRGPGTFEDWPSLAGFDRIDAVVPVPDQHSQFWFLSGDRYVRIHIADGEPHQDTVVRGPGSLDEWPSLAGFDRIDAVVPVPDQYGQFWFLSGDRYVRIRLADGEPHEDTVVRGPGTFEDWPSLAGFDRINAVVPVPDQHSQFWMLSGDRYVRIRITGGEPHQDTVVRGPGSLDEWPSLAKLQ